MAETSHTKLRMLISDIMTAEVITAKPSDSIGDALSLLEDLDIRHLPVVTQGQLVGLVSDRDLREYRLPVMQELEHPDEADTLLATPIAELMNKTIISVYANEKVKVAIDLMLEYQIGAIPVLDRHQEKLVGIISYIDILRAVRHSL